MQLLVECDLAFTIAVEAAQPGPGTLVGVSAFCAPSEVPKVHRLCFTPTGHMVKSHYFYQHSDISPWTKVLIEGIGGHEHLVEFCHFRNIPIADILVERICVVEHLLHIDHLRRVPLANVLVEGYGALKHRIHSGHGARVPVADRLIERFAVGEHLAHISHGGDVPGADVVIEVNGHEQFGHVSDFRCDPILDRSVPTSSGSREAA